MLKLTELERFYYPIKFTCVPRPPLFPRNWRLNCDQIRENANGQICA